MSIKPCSIGRPVAILTHCFQNSLGLISHAALTVAEHRGGNEQYFTQHSDIY